MTGPRDMDERLLDEALAWHNRLGGDDPDWDGFTIWLEANPQNRLAFDEIALVDRMVDERRDDLRQILPAAPEQQPADRTRRRRWILGSAAAMLGLAVGVPTLWPSPADMVYATGAGETRQLALADGTAVDLAPSSRLIVDGTDRTALTLAHGAAVFAVRHDPQRSLSVRVGDFAIRDLGTKFAINRSKDAVRVGVSEGRVAVAAGDGAETNVAAGEELIAMADGTARKSPVAIEDVGSWKVGRLVYHDTPLSIVLADISRYSGQRISVEPGLEQRRFSGVLAIGDGSNLLANLAKLMALGWRKDGDSIRLGALPAR